MLSGVGDLVREDQLGGIVGSDNDHVAVLVDAHVQDVVGLVGAVFCPSRMEGVDVEGVVGISTQRMG